MESVSLGARRAKVPGPETGIVEEKPPPTHNRRQWQRLLQRIFVVTPTCSTCGTEMKVIVVITEHEPIHKILDHLKSRKIDPRAGPFADQAT